ncbi:chemosensory receptor A [Elysia marginata]|uniref:Chemosensory receptor A n=1 Tax=Elysia marginata TaxID=1093978 RepID=A0AAV4EN23_9GAST|nr:chemosensory receptor A [Elysia marginata]
MDNSSSPVKPLVSFAASQTFNIFNFLLISLPISLFGMFSNVVNTIVFYKMGLTESSNVNFAVLSVSDFFVSLSCMLTRGLHNALWKDMPIWPWLAYAAHCTGHSTFVFISGSAMITTLISAERCVCVLFPLKVKSLLTRERSLFLTITVVAHHMLFLIIVYADTGPPYNTYPKKLSFYNFIFYTVPTTTCFFLVIITTILLVDRLRRNSKWRADTNNQNERKADKDNRLVRTIIAISTLFIVCTFPNVTLINLHFVYPQFTYLNAYLTTLVPLVFGISQNFQQFSSAVNMLFYFKLSSKYKKVILTMFPFVASSDHDSQEATQVTKSH